MKKYEVRVTAEALEQLRDRLSYLLFVKQSEQAYDAVLADYYETIDRLSDMAGTIRTPDEPELVERDLKKMLFLHHDYVVLFRIEGDIVYVVKIFHTSEDYLRIL